MTAAVSFERCDEDRYVLRFAYDPVLVSVVKAVPWRERDYDEDVALPESQSGRANTSPTTPGGDRHRQGVDRHGRRTAPDAEHLQALDEVSFWYITPFGRVRTGIKYSDGYATRKEAELELVGHDEHGILVKSVITTTRYIPGLDPHDMDEDEYERHKAAWVKMCDEFRSTPLILQGT